MEAISDINNLKKWEMFCDRLLQKTKDDEILWEDRSEIIHRSDSKSPMFVAEYKEWKILIYSYSYRYFIDDNQSDWRDNVAIELVDELGKKEWTVPQVPGRFSLFDHVQYRHAKVNSLLDALVGNEDV